LEIYFNSPFEVSEEELLTEVQFPVAKMPWSCNNQ
jgi:effector-binding domain-containing protein